MFRYWNCLNFAHFFKHILNSRIIYDFVNEKISDDYRLPIRLSVLLILELFDINWNFSAFVSLVYVHRCLNIWGALLCDCNITDVCAHKSLTHLPPFRFTASERHLHLSREKPHNSQFQFFALFGLFLLFLFIAKHILAVCFCFELISSIYIDTLPISCVLIWFFSDFSYTTKT